MNQRQIARELGVSQTTVSLVLNNPRTTKISKKKRDLVLNFFKKNNHFTQFGTSCTKNIAYLYEPKQRFYDRFISGIEAAAKKETYHVIVEKYQNGDNLIFPHKKVDGVILEGKVSLEEVKRISAEVPTVVLNSTISESISDMIYPDNRGGIQQAMQYLKEMGHRRIAYFSATVEESLHEANHNQRLDAFAGFVRILGFDKNDDYIQLPLLKKANIMDTEQGICKVLKFWKKMDKPPTAIICANDFYALQMIRQANILGIDIPGDFSIIGTDNLPGDEYSFPALTSIDHNAEEMGRLGVEILIGRINNLDRPNHKISCNASLVIRESVKKIN